VNLQTFPTSGISRATLLATSLGLAVVCQAVEPNIAKLDNATALNDGLSWSGGIAPGSGDIALWDATVTAANTTVLGADLSWAGIRIANPGGLVTINAGNTLTLGSAGIDMSAATQNFTLNNALSLGAPQTWNVADTRTLAATGAIGGTGALTKSGTGTLVFGAAANNFGGTVTISQGRLEIANASALAATANIVLGDANTGSAEPNLYLGNNLAPAWGSLTVAPNITNATIHVAGWAPLINGTTTLNSPLTIQRYNGNIHEGLAFKGKITGPGGGSGNDTLIFRRTGSNNYYMEMDTLAVANDFSGNVHVYDGELRLQGFKGGADPDPVNTFFPDTAMLTIEAAGRVSWNNMNYPVNETLDGLAGQAGARMYRGIPTYTLTINANNADNEGDRVYAGTIESMTGALTLGGTGTQEFSGASLNFSNATNLNNGTLKLTKTTGWNSNIAFGGSNTPKLKLNAPDSIDSWAFAKQLTGGSTGAVIEKVGAGTVNLAPAAGSSFVGSTTGAITVSEGKLYLNNNNITTAPAVSVAGGATFGGSSTAGNITVANGGTVDANPAGVGTLTAGNVTLGSTATGAVFLKGTLSASTSALTVNNLTINGGNQKLEISTSGTGLVNGTTYDLVTSANPITAPNASSVLASLKSNSRSQSLVVNPAGTKIQLYYDANATIYWTGAASDDWTTASANFKLSGNNSNTLFLANDVVFFHDNPVNSTVDIASADVSPAAVTFDNTTATEYTVESSGNFGIAAGSITKNNNGTVILSNSNLTSGAVSLNGGNMFLWYGDSLGTGPINFNGGTLTYDGLDTDWTRAISIAAGGGTVSVTGSAGTLNHIGSLSGAGTLTKAGDGTFALGGANGSYSSPVNIVGGTLELDNNAALGTANAITLGNTGSTNPTLRINATGMTLGALAVPAGVTNATVSFNQNSGTYSHTINGATLASALAVSQSGASFPNWDQVTWTSKITGNGGGSGNDTLVFSNTSGMQNYFTTNAGVTHDFAGNVHVTSGVVAVQSGAAASNHIIPDGSLLNITSGEWRWNTGGIVETLDGLAGGGTLGNPGNATLTLGLANPDNEGDRDFSGNFGGGSVLTLAGAGTQTFSGSGITYSGATNITGGGTLRLNNATSFASAVAVNGGGTLAGTGTSSANATIASGATVAPGSSTGTLTLASATLAGTYQCQLDGASGDLLSVTGALTLDPGAAINVSTLAAPTEASYTILTYGSLVGTLPTITGVPAGYSVDTSTPGVVKLVSGNAFDSWINGFASLTNPADKTQTADPDKDGLANILEFILNADPTSGISTNLPTVSASGSNLVFTYTRRDDSESFNPTVEFDADLAGTWTTAVDPTNCTIVVTENGASPDTVVVTIPKGANTKLFSRLKVTAP
jgi:autotransporter-associated beta strand protein